MRRNKQQLVAIALLAAGLAGTAPANAQNMDSDRSSNGGQRVGTGSGSILRDNSANTGTQGGNVGSNYEGALRSGTDVGMGQSGRNDGDDRSDRNARGFPIGLLGLAGLAGLANLFRRREHTTDVSAEPLSRRRAAS